MNSARRPAPAPRLGCARGGGSRGANEAFTQSGAGGLSVGCLLCSEKKEKTIIHNEEFDPGSG